MPHTVVASTRTIASVACRGRTSSTSRGTAVLQPGPGLGRAGAPRLLDEAGRLRVGVAGQQARHERVRVRLPLVRLLRAGRLAGGAGGEVSGQKPAMRPSVHSGDLLPLRGALGRHLAGVGVRRGEVEDGARQAGPGEGGRGGNGDVVQVLVEDDAPGGRGGELHVPG
ncbi:hypothetical protein ACWEOA_08760 [Streptomyces sp. NPDC004457]